MSNHTPGPWKTIKPRHGHETEYLSVQVGEDEMYTTLEMIPADAILVAAAPDLLACLREQVEKFWGDWGEELRESFRRQYWPSHSIARAEAAIAKATGGQSKGNT